MTIMNKRYSIIILFILLFSCKRLENEKYNNQMANFILSNKELKKNITSIFNIEDTTRNVFKVLISRRINFVRVTIYELHGKLKPQEFPSSYFTYKLNTFLCFDGSELLFDKKINHDIMDKINYNLTLDLRGVLYNSRVFQFDVGEKNNIKLNLPAINPYDFDLDNNKLDTVYFPPSGAIKSNKAAGKG